MATFTVEITPDSSNGTIAHAVGKFSGGSSSYKGQRRMDVAVSGVGTFSALSPETSGGENTFSLDITGLTPGTTYNWSASLYYKKTSGGWVTAGSQYDKSGSFTTKSKTPTLPKTLVNGTAYDVKGGKCLVNGTVYNIKKGRTLINGTGYVIKFQNGYTWVLNNSYTTPSSTLKEFDTPAFTSNGNKYSVFKIYGWECIKPGIYYDNTRVNDGYGFTDEAYRTITFDEAPTGDLLAWLQANAVQQ